MVTVDTKQKRGFRFRMKNEGKRFKFYQLTAGFLVTIRTSVPGKVEDMRID